MAFTFPGDRGKSMICAGTLLECILCFHHFVPVQVLLPMACDCSPCLDVVCRFIHAASRVKRTVLMSNLWWPAPCCMDLLESAALSCPQETSHQPRLQESFDYLVSQINNHSPNTINHQINTYHFATTPRSYSSSTWSTIIEPLIHYQLVTMSTY